MLFISKKIFIIYITRTLVRGFIVSEGKNPKVKSETNSISWQPGSLNKAFAIILKTMKKSIARILISDDISYITRINLPARRSGKTLRVDIANTISQIIPESLDNDEWDFKIEKQDTNTITVIVFAPLKGIFEEISRAAQKSQLTVVSIEPESIARRRNANPLFGLALKTTLEGSDEEILNLIPRRPENLADVPNKKMRYYPAPQEIKQKEKKKNHWLAIVILICIVGVAAILYWHFFLRKTEKIYSVKQTPDEIPTQAPTPQETEEPTQIPEEVDRSSYRIQVLNGTGVPGASTETATILRDEGFTTIETGNADSYDYTDTILQVKDTVPESIKTDLTDILNRIYTVSDEVSLTEDQTYDVLIIVGEKSAQ